jgi:hypothetical protein
MRNILAAIGAAVVAFLAVGWYLGWYQVSSTPSSKGPQAVQVDINPTKITDDVKKGVENGEKIVGSLREPTGADGKPATPPANGTATPANPTNPNASSGGWNPIGGTRTDTAGPGPRRGPGN